ncbi:MAG: discoidin domain-containing protein [Saprospiraceae bacterium]
MNKFFSLLLIVLFAQNVFAQQPQPSPEERAVQLSATVQVSPPQINLQWKADNGATEYTVYRKGLTDTNWGSPIATLPGNATSYVDANVQVGVGYEYAFFKEDFSNYEKTVCVPAGTPVKFTINDSNGIGLCCSFGNGFYELKNCNNTVAYGDDFGSTESTNFTVCNDGSGCSEIYITIKPSMIDNSTYWNLQNTSTGQIIDSDGAPGNFLRPRPEYGFIYAGIELPAIEDRGRVLLVIENDLVSPLATELAALEMDFIKDGWRVSTINVDRNDPVGDVHAAIKNVYNSNNDLKSVLLLGHVPIAYSGSIFPDTHTENEGAYPADVYYGEMDGTWTDNVVNTTATFLPIYHNVPGDGRFDQAVPPSGVVELQVGRVDFFDMPAFGQTEVQLVQQYLNKNHQFKTRQINPTRRALMDDNIGQTIGAPAATGYRNFSTMFGANNIFDTDYFSSMNSGSYLWSYGAGSGNANSAVGIGTTNSFTTSNLQNIFTLLFGSQFGNWAFDNSFLRAPLASGQTLVSCYAGNPPFSLHTMSMGYTIGDGLLATQNNPNDIYLPYGPGLISTALMGDPTLRMHMVEPPSNLQVSNNSNSVSLNWSSPTNETIVGYNIYRSSSVNGTFQKVNNNTITGTLFTDDSPLSGDNFYLVKTLKLETSGSGTYYNLSLGILGNTNFSGSGGDTTPPTATLSTAINNVTSDFVVNVNFSENINGLTLSDFNISNGGLSNLTGSNSSYSLTVSPINEGTVSIFLLAQSVSDLAGNLNDLPSNTLNINYTIPITGGCNNPTNIAINKPSSQHSTQLGADASRASDGNVDGNFWGGNSVTITNWDNETWWEIDLGSVADIDEIKVYNRTDCCSEILDNYYVLISDQPFNSTDLNSTLNQSGISSFYQNTQAGTPSTISINSTGRYVRVQLEGQGFLALAEVEVIGCSNSSTGLADQTISFDLISNKTITDGSFVINATASSGLPVSYSIISGPATIIGNTITLNGTTGTVVVQANQNGNATYNSASSVTQIFEVTEPSLGPCSTTSNIALGKMTTQSGTQLNADASRAVDGNTDGNFWGTNSSSLTNWVENAWWEVDLGEVSNIQSINLWNRTDCCADLFGNYYVLISDVPFTSQDLNSSISQTGVTSFLETGIADRPTIINVNGAGRYVRVQLAGTSFLAISEVEIIGCTNGGSCPSAGTPCDDNNTLTENDIEDGNCNCSGTPINTGCSVTNNVAVNKTTNQSSTLNAGGILGSSSKAVDGNTNGTFFTNPISNSSVSATQNEIEPWWEVDLGESFSLEQINIYNRTDGVDKTQNVYVLVSNAATNPFTDSDLATSRSQAEAEFYISGLVGSPSTIDLNIDARYIRVQMEVSGYLVLGEVEAIGCASNNLTNTPNSFIQSDQEIFFQAEKIDNETQLNWGCDLNDKTGLFILEKSSNGQDFEFLGKKESNSEVPHFTFYKKNDQAPLAGDNYYRLKLIQKNGSEVFSKIEKVNFGPSGDLISIFPNPAKNEISVNLKQYISKNVIVQIYDARGVLMEEKYLENLENPHPVFDLKKYENGLHIMAIKAEGSKMVSKKIIIEKGN